MGDPAYDARRAAERKQAEADLEAADAGLAAYQAITDLMTGKASIRVTQLPGGGGIGNGFDIKIVRG